MKSIFIMARCIIAKCMRNPLIIIAYVVTPLLISYMLVGSMDSSLNINLSKSQIEQSEINLKNNIIKSDENVVSTNDKVVMASVLLFLFYGAVLSSNFILQDLKNGVNDRMKSFPITKIKILLGKTIGSIGVMGIFAFISIIITSYLFNTNWGENKLILFAAILLFLIIESSFGIIVTGLSKNIYICVLATFAVNFFMVFPVYAEASSPMTVNNTLRIIDRLSFHSYVVKAAASGSESSIIILLLSAILLFFISLIVGRKVLE